MIWCTSSNGSSLCWYLDLTNHPDILRDKFSTVAPISAGDCRTGIISHIKGFFKSRATAFRDEIISNITTHNLFQRNLFISQHLIVYQKGDLVKQPMKSRDVLPKNVPGVGGGGVCHTRVGWSGSYRGGVGHVGVG